ncbi:hypothetical protein RRG08_064809 [Elysia crispata]|uniref:L-asparaginase N-terminal domain-containing protein n=1 Tax=Elysia crispata TaxID=231223 RepID=A0AAE1AWV9_9GAST|nr:hypothetical protein RRG08_064809 [Elysia crispata]
MSAPNSRKSRSSSCGDVLILQTGGTIDKSYPQRPGAYGFEICDMCCLAEITLFAVLNLEVSEIFEESLHVFCNSLTLREDILRYVVEANEQLVLITHGTDTMSETAQYLVRAGVGQGFDFGPGVGEKVSFGLMVVS